MKKWKIENSFQPCFQFWSILILPEYVGNVGATTFAEKNLGLAKVDANVSPWHEIISMLGRHIFMNISQSAEIC